MAELYYWVQESADWQLWGSFESYQSALMYARAYGMNKFKIVVIHIVVEN